MRKRSVSRALNARWLAAIFEDVDAEVRRETAYTANQALGVIQEETDAVLDAFPDDVAKVAGRFVRDRVAGGPTVPESLTLAENDDMTCLLPCVQCGRPLPEARRYEHLCSDECQKAMDAYIAWRISRRPKSATEPRKAPGR